MIRRHGSNYSHDSTFYRESTGADGFRFLAYGDNRGENESGSHNNNGFNEYAAAVVRAMLPKVSEAQFVVHVGDFVYTGSTAEQWRQHFFLPTTRLIAEYPLFPVRGNHESSLAYYQDFFDYPDDPNTGAYPTWYSFDCGNSHFVVLDSNATFTPGSNQWGWLIETEPDLENGDLPDANARRTDPGDIRWIFAFDHHPALPRKSNTEQYSHDGPVKGGHGWNDPNEPDDEPRTHLVPEFEQYGVDFVFCGHNHFCERAHRLDGVNPVYGLDHVTTGGAGAPGSSGARDHNPTDSSGGNYQREYAEPTYGFCIVTVSATDNTALFSGTRENGYAMDIAAKLRSNGSIQATEPRLPGPGDDEWVDLIPRRTGAWWYNQTDNLDGDDWTAPDYDESGNWQSGGTTEFWYDDEENGTELGAPDGDRHTYYFRKHFSLTEGDLAATDFLTLKVLHDDACAVFLNGVEVSRSNLAAGAGHDDDPDDYAVGQPYEDIFLQFVTPKSLLVAGDNVVCAEVHGWYQPKKPQQETDLGFDLSLHAIEDSWWPGD